MGKAGQIFQEISPVLGLHNTQNQELLYGHIPMCFTRKLYRLVPESFLGQI